jgi:hypothetical protein
MVFKSVMGREFEEIDWVLRIAVSGTGKVGETS